MSVSNVDSGDSQGISLSNVYLTSCNAADIDAASLCSSPSSVKVRLRNTFLDFKEGTDSFCHEPTDSPRADSLVDFAFGSASPLRRSQSDCTGVDKYIRERLGSNVGVGDEVDVDCDPPFSPTESRSPISSRVHLAGNRGTDISILSFSPPTFQTSPMDHSRNIAGAGTSDFVMIMEEDPPAPRVRPPSISPCNPISSISTQPSTPNQFSPCIDGVRVPGDGAKTTVMLRNIPNKYTQRMLLDQLNAMGYEGKYDFFYLPIDFRNRCNVGYAFINFVSTETAKVFKNHLDGYRLTGFNSQKICEVSFARVQGLDANILHYRNSPVNGVAVPEYRPLLFADGKEIPFPFAIDGDSQF